MPPSLGRLAPTTKRDALSGGPGRSSSSLAGGVFAPPPSEDSRADLARWVRGVGSSVVYLVFSTAIILSNKHIITETNFSCPITVSSLGSLFGWIVALLAVSVGGVELKSTLTLRQWFIYVLPVGVCTALSLAFANIAYFYLALSFIQMVKAFAPVVTCAVLVAFGLDRFDANVALAIGVIVAGCFTASFGEIHARSAQLGLGCMLICEIAEAFRSAGMQYLLANRSFSLFDGLYYFSPATLLFLCALIYAFEWDDLKDPEHLRAVGANPGAFLAASCLGFFVNLASLAVIQSAGSLTLKIVSQLKNLVVIVAAVVLYDDVVTMLELAGYVVAMFGFAMYQEAKWKGAELADEEERARLARGTKMEAMTTDEEDARRGGFHSERRRGKRASEGGEGGESGRSGRRSSRGRGADEDGGGESGRSESDRDASSPSSGHGFSSSGGGSTAGREGRGRGEGVKDPLLGRGGRRAGGRAVDL